MEESLINPGLPYRMAQTLTTDHRTSRADLPSGTERGDCHHCRYP